MSISPFIGDLAVYYSDWRNAARQNSPRKGIPEPGSRAGAPEQSGGSVIKLGLKASPRWASGIKEPFLLTHPGKETQHLEVGTAVWPSPPVGRLCGAITLRVSRIACSL